MADPTLTVDAHVALYQKAGERISVDGVHTHVTRNGTGVPVLCFHGVPVSGFVYRKILPALAERGLQGIAFDLPGCGLAERPAHFDYSWTGLGKFVTRLADVLRLENFHLLLHDIGGPIGLEVAAALKERILSLTLLNTMVRVGEFNKPAVMQPFGVPLLNRLYLWSMIPTAVVPLMYAQGVSDSTLCTPQELKAHLKLLKRGDGGTAFLKIMQGFETTAEKQSLYLSALQDVPYPVQAVWGSLDPALRLDHHGEIVRTLVSDRRFFEVPGKHFLQETHWNEIASQVALLAGRTARSA